MFLFCNENEVKQEKPVILWQAAYHVVFGVIGNPLIGNFYGRDVYDEEAGNDWDIDWTEADCGYGMTQITDGMRKVGHEKPGEIALAPMQQRAAALDYAANIAAGLRILQKKWNQLYEAGLTLNDGDPQWIENWFLATWAYNSGFYPDRGDASPWGLGWFNNPANPRYPANRLMFRPDMGTDAAHPQDWPYPEKIVGWAAFSIVTREGKPGFRTAWWTSEYDRTQAVPARDAFCTESNDCDFDGRYQPQAPDVLGEIAGPCHHRNEDGLIDLKCWWHEPLQWKICQAGFCGHAVNRFEPWSEHPDEYPEPPDADQYPPNCSSVGLPDGALVIDNVAASIPSVRPYCPTQVNHGSFKLQFSKRPSDPGGVFPSKVDFHQIGGGYGGHFWFSHTHRYNDKMRIRGTWTLDRSLNQWARVLVHMPDHGAHTQQARYEIDLGDGQKKVRYALQRTSENRWVSLGVMKFSGIPSISLSNQTWDGNGSEDIAWDAVAFEPLEQKPAHFIVHMGDSYSSGEGASELNGADYYPETDNNGDNIHRNACHRSRQAWSRKAKRIS